MMKLIVFVEDVGNTFEYVGLDSQFLMYEIS